jgi:DNA replication protein DnaC
MQNLLEYLKEFKLSGMVKSLNERIVYAQNNKLGYQEFLGLLCEDEQDTRRDNNYKRRQSNAKLPVSKKIEDFDFAFQPSIEQKLINDLAICQFINKKENVILIGNPGTGKTHLAIGLAQKALQREYKVFYSTVSDMLYNLHISKADNSYHKKLKTIVEYDLLILDELGFKQIPKYSSDDFFNIIARRYESKSTIITTNKNFNQWNEVFGDEILTRAIIDRVIHHAYILEIKGKSYRMSKSSKNNINLAEDNMG